MQVNRRPEVPPFGIAYISQELKKHNHEVSIIDIDSNRFSREEVSALIMRNPSDMVGIGGLVTVYPYLYWLVPEIRRISPDAKIVLGGAIASSLKGRCFDKFDIDYEVIGEGEITILELIDAIRKGGDFAKVKGIGFRKDGKVVFTEPRPLKTSLEDLPFFDDTPFPIEKLLLNTKGVFQIHAQRGCPSSCTFCFNAFRVVSKHVRYRSVKDVVREMAFFKKKYGNKIKLFAISGECITMNKKWIIDLCKEIAESKLNIKYRVTSRVDTIDEERLYWLKKSGCVKMLFGLESGSDRILKIMKKGTTVEQGLRAVAMAGKYIPNIEASVILGYEGEDKSSLRQTVEFCKKLGVRPVLFYTAAFPGTEIYDNAVRKGIIKDEEAYMMNLDRTLIGEFSLNLTDMPDDEARREIESAAKEIEKYYLWREIKNMAIFKRIFARISEDGFLPAIDKIVRRIGKLHFQR